jgi:hypothetical protein
MLSGINLKFNSLFNPLNLRVFESEFRQVLILAIQGGAQCRATTSMKCL